MPTDQRNVNQNETVRLQKIWAPRQLKTTAPLILLHHLAESSQKLHVHRRGTPARQLQQTQGQSAGTKSQDTGLLWEKEEDLSQS